MKNAEEKHRRLIQAQATALRAEQRYWRQVEQDRKDARLLLVDENLLTLEGMGRQLVRLLEFAVDRLVKPALKRNQITYRAGLAFRDAVRKGIRRTDSTDELP